MGKKLNVSARVTVEGRARRRQSDTRLPEGTSNGLARRCSLTRRRSATSRAEQTLQASRETRGLSDEAPRKRRDRELSLRESFSQHREHPAKYSTSFARLVCVNNSLPCSRTPNTLQTTAVGVGIGPHGSGSRERRVRQHRSSIPRRRGRARGLNRTSVRFHSRIARYVSLAA